MRKAFLLGLAGSFFFASTFVLNRSMNLSGGHWIWSASLRYFFTLPMLALIVIRRRGFESVHRAIARNPREWFLWSTVGFGLFYANLLRPQEGPSQEHCSMRQPLLKSRFSCVSFRFGTCLPLYFDPKMDAPADIFLL